MEKRGLHLIAAQITHPARQGELARNALITLLAALLTILLGGCGIDFAFTPEAAVAKEVSRSPMPDFKADPNSVQILQKQPLGKNFLMLVAFKGIRANSGAENCMFSYEVMKSPAGGWMTGGGGGGCSNQPADPENQPIGIGGGTSGGGEPGDPGYSSVYGEVVNPEVKTVQVTWDDGTVAQAAVVNSSYLSIRAGELRYTKVEALDAQGKPVFTWEPNVPPGKQ